jgi:hypothetical protein
MRLRRMQSREPIRSLGSHTGAGDGDGVGLSGGTSGGIGDGPGGCGDSSGGDGDVCVGDDGAGWLGIGGFEFAGVVVTSGAVAAGAGRST